MQSTINLDDALVDKARSLTGTQETAALVRQALETLVRVESGKRLVTFGGTMPNAEAAPRPPEHGCQVILADTSIWIDHFRHGDTELSSNMRPAECQRDGILGRKRAITAVTIDLQDSDEAVEMGHRSVAFTVRRIDIGDAGRVLALPWPVISRIGPKLSSFGFAAPRIEHRRRRLVREELG